MRRITLVALMALTVAVGSAPLPFANAEPLPRKLLALINDTRVDHGLRPLKLRPPLADDAARHTQRMIRRGAIFDPDLRRILEPYTWDVAGAVTGCHRSARALVRAWLRSAVHRSVLLNPGLRRIGVGADRVGGRSACGDDPVWATAIAYG
jgi:uncharacterized protein YkwD